MKRLFSLAMAGMMLFSVPAFAATTTIDQIDPGDIVGKNTNDKYDVSYEDAQQGKEYMLWALKGVYTDVEASDFAQGNVLYVDQETGGASGVSYDGFLPMKSADSTLVITGQGMTKPVIIGYIKGEGNAISGNIGLNGRSVGKLGGAVVTLTSTEDASAVFTAVTADDGTFTMDGVADGTYKLTVSKQYYVGYSAAEFVVDAETVWEQEIILMPGDVDESGGVGRGDLTIFRKAYVDVENVDLKCDFDGSGGIGRGDLTLFRTSWNQAN